jgi:hypothetical protein
VISKNELDYRDGTRCNCGAAKMSGSRSCRPCFVAGKGVKPGRKGRSIETMIKEAGGLKPGESLVIDGLRFTRKRNGE